MQTWWLAIDTDYTSYQQLKDRKVMAQGWPQVGDLRTLCPLAAYPAQKNLVKSVVVELEKLTSREDSRTVEQAGDALWNLLQIQHGDLVVGIEGRRVRGICQVSSDATASYHFDSTGQYNYAQTVCSPAEWIDWNNDLLGIPPMAPMQSVVGVERLVKDSEQVAAAWDKFRSSTRTRGERARKFVWEEGDIVFTHASEKQYEPDHALADRDNQRNAETSGNAQTAFDIIEDLGDEMDLMHDPQKSDWKAYLTSLAYAKVKAAGYIYELGSQEFIKVWDNQTIPFVIHMRLAGIDDTMEEGKPGAYGCRRELEETGISPSQPTNARSHPNREHGRSGISAHAIPSCRRLGRNAGKTSVTVREPTMKITAEDFLTFARSLDCQELSTKQGKPFRIVTTPNSIQFELLSPDSKGSVRTMSGPEQIHQFLLKYEETNSTKPGDYNHIDGCASYNVAILKRYVAERSPKVKEL